MNVILDTHVFIWIDGDPSRLSPTAMNYLTDPANIVYLSVVNVWEAVIKSGVGKLTLSAPLPKIVSDFLTHNPVTLLDVTLPHVFAVQGLPSIHRDPFDRILIGQTLAENAILLTDDPQVRRYPVPTAW